MADRWCRLDARVGGVRAPIVGDALNGRQGINTDPLQIVTRLCSIDASLGGGGYRGHALTQEPQTGTGQLRREPVIGSALAYNRQPERICYDANGRGGLPHAVPTNSILALAATNLYRRGVVQLSDPIRTQSNQQCPGRDRGPVVRQPRHDHRLMTGTITARDAGH